MTRILFCVTAALLVACEDATGPNDAVPLPSPSPVVASTSGTFRSDVVLSGNLARTGAPITYTVDFGRRFSSISRVSYVFVFGDDPLNHEDCLYIYPSDVPSGLGGFCNPGATPQTSRQFDFPCTTHPEGCDHFRDGMSGGKFTAESGLVGGPSVSVSLRSVTITIEGDASAAGELSFRQISASVGAATCGVTDDYRAYCWGHGRGGQLGQGTFTNSQRPVAVAGGIRFREVATAFSHTCGLATDGRAYCWGAGERLGAGPDNDAHATPVPVAGGLRFLKIDVAVFHSCGVTTTNRVYCWGDNFHGMLGDGTNQPRYTPVPVAGGRRYITVSTGNGHTCAITTTNRAYCWGSNNFGKLGNGSAADRSLVPVRVAGTHSFARLSTSWDHTCGVTLNNRAWCWGYGENAQIGDGTRVTRNTPRPVAGGLSISRVRGGVVHSCALTTAGRAYCWGENDYGELGTGSNDVALRPARVAGGLIFKELSAGSSVTCGITTAGRAYCWGAGTGDGTTEPRSVPTPVASPE